jgi:bla regulator protein BlaR1
MDFRFLKLMPENWVQALGATFFHSLWVGLILALLTSLVIISSRNSAAYVRYNLLTGLMLCFVVAVGFIFYKSLDFETLPKSSVSNVVVKGSVELGALTQLQSMASQRVLNGLDVLMNLWLAYSAQIVMIWFLIICIKCVKLVANLNTINYLKNNQVFDAGSYWEQKVAEISSRLGISDEVQLLQSGIAKVPMVAGHLKPMILVPLGFLNGLAAAEVDAILCHELAHIKRRDYLVNFIQSLIEIVFFFNPAILWVSKLIRAERENCCDDLAIACTSDKKVYIKALISCEEYQFKTPEFALSIRGQDNQLLDRVKRMVYNKSATLNTLEKMVLTVALISGFLFMAAFTTPSASKTVGSEFSNSLFQDTTKKAKVKKTVGKKAATRSAKVVSQTKHVHVNQHNNVQTNVLISADVDAAKADARAAKEDAKASKEDAKVAIEDARVAKEYAKIVANDKKLAAYPPAPPLPPGVRSASAMPVLSPAERMTGDLVKDGIVKNGANFMYKLSGEELIVNGDRQPEAIHRKYRNRYLTSAKQTITVTVNNN